MQNCKTHGTWVFSMKQRTSSPILTFMAPMEAPVTNWLLLHTVGSGAATQVIPFPWGKLQPLQWKYILPVKNFAALCQAAQPKAGHCILWWRPPPVIPLCQPDPPLPCPILSLFHLSLCTEYTYGLLALLDYQQLIFSDDIVPAQHQHYLLSECCKHALWHTQETCNQWYIWTTSMMGHGIGN